MEFYILRPLKNRQLFWVAFSVLCQAVLFLIISLFLSYQAQPILFYGSLIISFLPYLLTYRLLKSNKQLISSQLWPVFLVLVPLGLSLCFLQISPNIDHDVLRYKWDGYLSASGLNPYEHRPDDFKNTIIAWRFPYYQELQFKDFYAIYPIVSQLIFLLDFTLFHFSFLGTKLLLDGFFLGSILILMAIFKHLHKPMYPIWLFGANPLVLYETVGTVHNDVVMIFFLLVTFFLIMKKHWIASGVFLALAIGTKFVPILVLPIIYFSSRSKRLLISLLVSTLIIFSPALLFHHPERIFTSLLIYSQRWTYTPGLFALVQWLLESLRISSAFLITKVFFWLGYLFLLFHFSKRVNQNTSLSFLVESIVWIFGYILVANSVAFPWYVIWVVAFVPFLRKPVVWIVLSITTLLIPLGGYGHEGRDILRQTLVWIPVYVTLWLKRK